MKKWQHVILPLQASLFWDSLRTCIQACQTIASEELGLSKDNSVLLDLGCGNGFMCEGVSFFTFLHLHALYSALFWLGLIMIAKFCTRWASRRSWALTTPRRQSPLLWYPPPPPICFSLLWLLCALMCHKFVPLSSVDCNFEHFNESLMHHAGGAGAFSCDNKCSIRWSLGNFLSSRCEYAYLKECCAV